MRTPSTIYYLLSHLQLWPVYKSQRKVKNTPRTHLANCASEGNILPNPCGQPAEAMEHETLF